MKQQKKEQQGHMGILFKKLLQNNLRKSASSADEVNDIGGIRVSHKIDSYSESFNL
jgi:hypothetical protein